MADFDAMLDEYEAEPAERTVNVCLKPTEYFEWEQLSDELEQALERPRSSMSDDGGVQAIQVRMDELAEQMRSGTVAVRLRQMRPAREFSKLLVEHPPRKDNRIDQSFGVNKDTFFEALLPKSVVDVMAADGDVHVPKKAWLDRMVGLITTRQRDELFNAAFLLNGGAIDVPFSSTASHTTQDSAETSRRRSGSASASGGSKAGNRKKSSSTSTTSTDG